MSEKSQINARAVFMTAVLPILLSGIVRALGIYIFVSPNKFAPGGTNGIAVLLEYVTKWNSGWFLLMINVPLFFLAFFLLGKREAIISTLSMLLTSGLLIVFDYIPNFPRFDGTVTEEPIVYGMLAAMAGGIFLGAALAIMIKSCGTAGGTAVLASLVKKKWSFLSVSWLTSGFDAIVVFVSFFVYYPWSAPFTSKLVSVLLALVSLVVTSKTSDLILQGYKTAYRFEIVTNQAEEIAKEIMETTHHGVTGCPASACIRTANTRCSCVLFVKGTSPRSRRSSKSTRGRLRRSRRPPRCTENSSSKVRRRRGPNAAAAPFLRSSPLDKKFGQVVY